MSENGQRPAPVPDQRREARPDPQPARRPPDELEVLIRARYPIIYVVTWEEERLEQRLNEIARRRNKTFHVWTCSQGVVKFGADPQRGHKSGAGNTCNPIAGLDAVLSYVDPAIFLF